MAPLVARRLAPVQDEVGERSRAEALKNVLTRYVPGWLKGGEQRAASPPLLIKGTEGMVVTFAKCCRPIPGDPILGFVTSGRGIVIHTESCKNVAEYRSRPEKWIDVQWAPGISNEFPSKSASISSTSAARWPPLPPPSRRWAPTSTMSASKNAMASTAH